MFHFLQVAQPVPTDFTQWGIAGAVVFIVVLFLWFLTKEREDRKAERDSLVSVLDRNSEAIKELNTTMNNLIFTVGNNYDNSRNGTKPKS